MLGFSASLWKSSCWNSTSICISTTSTTSKYWGWLHWKTRKTRNGILAWTARTATRAANKQINDEKLFQEDNSCSRRSIYKIETTATKLFLARKFKYVYLGVEDVLFKLRKCGLSGAQTSSRSKSNPEKEEESENNSNFAEMKIQTKMTVGNRTQVLPKRNRRDTDTKKGFAENLRR